MGLASRKLSRTKPLDDGVVGVRTSRYTKLVASGPIAAVTGQVIRGLRITGTSGIAINIGPNVHDVLIEDCEIGPMNLGGTAGNGIQIESGAYNIVIRHCTIHGVSSGLYAVGAKHPIVFDANYVYDVLGPMPRGQMVQFNNVNGGTGQSRVTRNISDALARTQATHYEDHISMYESSGTAATPILIACNRIRGGDSQSGSGLMIGDWGTSLASAGHYYDVRYNIVVDVPNTGIGVPGGGDMTFTANWVSNRMATRSDPYTEGGFYVTKAANIVYDSNRAISNGWASSGGALHYSMWDDGSNTNVTYTNNNWQDETLTSAVFDAPHPLCQSMNNGTASQTVSLPAPYSAYRFNEGAGATVNDASGNNHNLTLNTAIASWTGGHEGNAIRTVNGGAGAIGLATPTSNELTIMAWYKVDVLNGYQALFEVSGAPIQISVIGDGKISVMAEFGTRSYFLSSKAPTTGVWRHLAVTISATTMALYIDGSLDTSQAVTYATPFALAGVDTKICGSDGQPAVDMTMDDLRVYDKVLSDAQISEAASKTF